ncbi:MAG: rRNA adenine N-6-methyltransferase family protein, partial [Verrucomicrobiota bacterium]
EEPWPDKLISNLPYSDGNRILMNYFMADIPFERMVIMVQDDVAERLCAGPGSRDYSLLSIWTQLDYEVVERKTIRPGCFYPAPSIDSTLLAFQRRNTASPRDRGHFARLLKLTFGQRRKQIATQLRKAPKDVVDQPDRLESILEEIGIRPTQRPEELPVDVWVALSDRLQNHG